jgi:hypothetical protein
MATAELRIGIRGWYDGASTPIDTWHDKSPWLNVAADTLVWYPGKVQHLPLWSKPASIDSAAWVNGGDIGARRGFRAFPLPQGNPVLLLALL